MEFTTMFVFLIPLVVARHHHRTLLETILKSKGNFYTKVNEDVQNVINSIFDSLSLKSTFLTKARIKSLLTMHYDLNKISEENFDVYSSMINATKIDNRNKTRNKIEFYELIEEIFNDKTFNLSDIKLNTNESVDGSIAEIEDPDEDDSREMDADFDDSNEFMQFIKDFADKVDNISVNDFTTKSPLDSLREPNLKIWRPPPILELDYVNETKARRIYRGKRTTIKSYAFMVSIHVSGVFSCSGSIISHDLVITAASCLQLLYNNRFFRENPKNVYVRVGSDYFYKGGEKIDVVETYFHPSYDPQTLHNNLVILRLQFIIKFRRHQKKVRRILYDQLPQHVPSNTDGVVILGWGSRKASAIINPFQKLTVANLEIYPIKECVEIYSSRYVTDKHFCAGFLATGGGACNKDVGGPGIIEGILTGVVSFGPPVCGAVDAPTVFVKLGHYEGWISEIMEMHPAQRGVRTTLRPYVEHIRTMPPQRPKKHTMTPFVDKITIATESSQRSKLGDDEILTLRNILKQLSQTNSSILYDLLYGDLDDEDIFKVTEKVDDMHHPLINKSVYMIPEVHTYTYQTDVSVYVTLPLTTSSTKLPPTTTEPPTRTTSVTTHAPVGELRAKIAKRREDTDSDDSFLLSADSELRSGQKDELEPDQKYYDNSYGDDELQTVTVRPKLGMNLHRSRHRHQRRHQKKRRPGWPRMHKGSKRREHQRQRKLKLEHDRVLELVASASASEHHGIQPINDVDPTTDDADYDEDLSYHELNIY